MHDNPNRFLPQRGSAELSMWEVREFEKKYLQLKKDYRDKDGKLKGLMAIFDTMRADFAYNLDLIRKRDVELEEYENSVKLYTTSLSKKDIENSKQRNTIDELRNATDYLKAKITDLEKELLKSRLETKRERERGDKSRKVQQKQFDEEVETAHRATVTAEHWVETHKQRLEEITKALEEQLEKSEKARIRAELDFKTLQQEKQGVESQCQSAKNKIKTLDKKLKMKSSLNARLEQENMEKSKTVVWLRKRVEVVWEEAVIAYEKKVKKLVEQLTLLQKQTTQQQSIFQEQVAKLEDKLKIQEEKHRSELKIILKKKDRLKYLETKFQKKSSIAESQVQKAQKKLIEQDNALQTLNFDLNRALKRGEALSSELAEERTKFKGKLEEADERITKLAEEREALQGKKEHYRKLAEEKGLEEQLKASGIVKKIRLDRDAHFQELTRLRRELENTRSRLVDTQGQDRMLEEKNSKLQQVITEMRIESELSRKKFETHLDRKAERISKYKEKDSEMKRVLVELAMEKNLAVMSSDFRPDQLKGELSKARKTLNMLSDERDQLVDINNYLRDDVDGLGITQRRAPFTRKNFSTEKRFRAKRSKLRKKLDEITGELTKRTRTLR